MERQRDDLFVGGILVVAVGSVVTIFLAIPYLRPSRVPHYGSYAIAGLRAYLGAQNQFKRTDFYGIGKLVYANPSDGVGFSDLYQVGHPSAPRGEVLNLTDVWFADANARNPSPKPKGGYYFADLIYKDYEIDCGLCAVPASYNRSGRNIYIVDVTGTVYQKDAAMEYPGLRTGDKVPPLTRYPGDRWLVTWTPVGCE